MDSSILSDLAADAADYEAESWSLAVEHKFCKKQDKRAVKRQDVIYGERTVTFRQSKRSSPQVAPGRFSERLSVPCRFAPQS